MSTSASTSFGFTSPQALAPRKSPGEFNMSTTNSTTSEFLEVNPAFDVFDEFCFSELILIQNMLPIFNNTG